MAWRLGLAALVLLFPGAHVAMGESRALLPDAPEKELIQQHCVRCHSIDWIEQMEGTESEWTMRVRRMLRRGSELPQDRIAPLAAYLAQALPRRVRAEAMLGSPVKLAVSEVAWRSVQIWIRGSGKLEDGGSTLLAELPRSDGSWVRVGQRARAFSLAGKSSMHQGKVVRVEVGKEKV